MAKSKATGAEVGVATVVSVTPVGEPAAPPKSENPIDAFFEDYGFAGGRYIVVMFLFVFITSIFFAFQWRSARIELQAVKSELVEIKELLRTLAPATCTSGAPLAGSP